MRPGFSIVVSSASSGHGEADFAFEPLIAEPS